MCSVLASFASLKRLKKKPKKEVSLIYTYTLVLIFTTCCYSISVIADYIHPLASSVTMLNHLLCPKVVFPCAERDGQPVVKASIFRRDCCENNCDRCDNFAADEHSVFQCPTIFNNDSVYHWREFTILTLDNGCDIKELKDVTGTLDTFKLKFLDALVKYKKHYFQYRWLNLVRKADLLLMGPNDLYVQTDYAAQPTLDSQDKLNSVGHGVCVLSCWVVLHSPRRTFYRNKAGENVYYTYFTCDHIRVVTPSTGKQKDQDWYLHCNIFEYLLSHYKQQVPNLKNIVLWTDGARNQYKCRQNFFWLANVEERFHMNIVHRFGATAQFKGIHDKIGQVAKWIVR